METSMPTPENLASDLAELESAEEFLEYFGLDFVPEIVHVNRLHILQRFHDYLGRSTEKTGAQALAFADYRRLLEKAYEDFVHSDAITEKVFRVLKSASGIATIPVSAIGRARH